MSVTAILCFGIDIGDQWVPWDTEEYEYDINRFYISEELDVEPEVIPDSVLAEILEHSPCPVVSVRSTSDDPSYIIAVPGTLVTAYYAFPEKFIPEDLKVDQYQIDKLIEFCLKYLPPKDYEGYKLEPKWYISCQWD